ncbi:hypothetical protein CRI77_22295 [Mycolicibacterium duvalii]|uniref:Membrane protein n=1 Tax=Mycolicibacterium duvalii TaxID=39688 RepID=A0A7I7JTL4_9MYCO|nr:DUF4245 domain-containing protein [Mycolicibacterium duvalii]MCV7368504.1 DUF4245 domain-containing protein [Mycolicibacterium duvalii]PEG36718.1 hypothetical protein CRI77_22295 [Mycolicibacterium duvalii]BBX15197.1 membrane protein [Mycolicibacterium duvalii]
MTTPPEPGPTVTGAPGPRPPKSRLLQDGRDMFWSMAPLVVACLVLAGVLGMCSFAPSGPGPGPTPDYDAPAGLRADAAALDIPIRIPDVPDGWQSNSGSRKGIESGRTDPASGLQVRAVASTVGYLTPTGRYLSVTQSDADEDRLIASFGRDLVPTGTQDVDGVNWVVYQGGERDGRPPEPVWTTRLGGPTGPAQIALTGAGDTDEFRTLAAATQSQPPLTTT